MHHLAIAMVAYAAGPPLQRLSLPGIRHSPGRICLCVPGSTAEVPAWVDLAAPDETVPALSPAEICRTILTITADATLCTRMESSDAGFVSHVPFTLDDDGMPIFPVDEGSQAAHNMQGSTDVSLLVQSAAGKAHAGSTAAMFGTVEAVAERELSSSVLASLSGSTGLSQERLASRQWQRLNLKRLHYTDRAYGTETWVEPSDFNGAQPNLLATDVPTLLAKLNGKHSADVARFARVYASLAGEEVHSTVLSVDQLGFDLSVQRSPGDDAETTRVGLKVPPQTLEEAISAFTKLFQEAYAREQGWM